MFEIPIFFPEIVTYSCSTKTKFAVCKTKNQTYVTILLKTANFLCKIDSWVQKTATQYKTTSNFKSYTINVTRKFQRRSVKTSS